MLLSHRLQQYRTLLDQGRLAYPRLLNQAYSPVEGNERSQEYYLSHTSEQERPIPML